MGIKNKYSEFSITDDPDLLLDLYNIPKVLRTSLLDLYDASQDENDKTAIPSLIKLIESYPHVPHFKNYLSVAYSLRGQYPKAIATTQQIIIDHPDYLFGKVNLALDEMYHDHYEIIPQLLGEHLNLKELYPDRTIFHVSEAISFYSACLQYYVGTENLPLAQNTLDFLKKLDPNHHTLENNIRLVRQLRLKAAITKPFSSIKSWLKKSNIPKLDHPHFTHNEVTALYRYQFDIDQALLEAIIVLPHLTLITDLEMMLQDAITKYPIQEQQQNEGHYSFPIHAIFILAEIQAVQSIPAIIRFLEQEDRIIDYWITNYIIDHLWQPFYKLARAGGLSALSDSLTKPTIPYFIKESISQGILQIYLHDHTRKADILEIYQRLFTKYRDAGAYSDNIDPEFLSIAVQDAAQCQFQELLPVIRDLFAKNCLSPDYFDDIKEVEYTFSHSDSPDSADEIYSISELYEILALDMNMPDLLSILNKNDIDGEADNDFIDDDSIDLDRIPYYTPPMQIIRSEPKIGRNEPCPCGSGKKYKKCHGG